MMTKKQEDRIREQIKQKEKEIDKLKDLYFDLKLKRIEGDQKGYEKDKDAAVVNLGVALQQVAIGYPDVALGLIRKAEGILSEYAGIKEEGREHLLLSYRKGKVKEEEIRDRYREKQHKHRTEELEGEEQMLKGILLKGPYDWYLDWKSEQLDKEVMNIVEGAISRIIMASLASGIPCDPDTSDGIRDIERCLEKMKKDEKK